MHSDFMSGLHQFAGCLPRESSRQHNDRRERCTLQGLNVVHDAMLLPVFAKGGVLEQDKQVWAMAPIRKKAALALS